MSDAATLALAHSAGLAVEWTDFENRSRTVQIDVLRRVLDALGLPATTPAQCQASMVELAHITSTRRLITAEVGQPIALPGRPGAWRVTLEDGTRRDGRDTETTDLPVGYHQVEAPDWSGTLAVAPRRGWTLEDAGAGVRLAGLAAQLYALSRQDDARCGDFIALAELARRAAPRGIDAVAISPVHALFTADPGRAAPYAPSSRVALNPVYVDSGAGGPAETELIDWPAVVTTRLAALRQDFARDAGGAGFATFRRQATPELHCHALFETIAAAEVAKGGAPDWRRWPAELASPFGAAANRFVRDAAEDVAFHLYLQYRARLGLADAQQAARQAGMRIGLIADLAVGADPGGSDAWMGPEDMLRGLSIGAPPDAFNQDGQGWGLVSFSPFGLLRSGFAGWLRMVRAAMADAGGVRIDHAMGLARLWVIPDGESPQDGVYLSYPCQDLLRLLALESFRNRSVVLAEDLGTIPAGFPEQLAASGMAGLRVLWFEQMYGGFRSPADWTREAVAMTSTHDLPTVAGWWSGRDIAWREQLGLRHEGHAARHYARHDLWNSFRAAGVAEGELPGADDGDKVATAAAGFIGRTASRLALLPLEDALALEEQPNLPGTISGHPNWRRRLPMPVETLLDQPDVAARLDALRAGRGHP